MGCQGDQQSCNAHVDPSPLHRRLVQCPPGLLHTAQGLRPLWTPIVLYRCRSYLLTSAGVSQCTLHFFLLFCELTAVWNNCALRFNTMCLWLSMPFILFYFKQRFSLPFILKDSRWFSCTCLSIAQRYFPKLLKWDLGTSGRTVEVVHAVWTLYVFYTMVWEEKYVLGPFPTGMS